MSLLHDIEKHAAEQPHKAALTDGLRRVDYLTLLSRIDAYRKKLTSRNCTRLAIAGDNGIDWILWDLAAAFGNIPVIPVPPFFTAAQIDMTLHAAGASHIASASILTDTNIIKQPALPQHTAKITFTSGSTGTPKGVCLPLDGLETVSGSIGQVLGTKYAGHHLCVLPLSILLENVAGVYTALRMGATVYVPSLTQIGMTDLFHPDFDALVAYIRQYKITSIILVPELLRGLMASIDRSTQPKPETLQFIAVGGAKISTALLESAVQAGLPVYEGYGLSECGSVVSLNTPNICRSETAGKLLPHVKAHVDSNGDIIIDNACFLGYLGAPVTQQKIFSTGDIGALDAHGFLKISGRRKNLIITGYGRNISPEWIESVLLSQPGILQAVVYGDGEAELAALIVAQSDTASITAVMDTVNKTLPSYARIGHFRCISPLTAADGFLTKNGRIRRDNILAHYLQKETAMTFYERLQKETSLARQNLYTVPQLVDGLRGEISRETYIAYLTEAYHHVKHTVRFLMAMGARLPEDKKWLHNAIAEYIDEEKGHEEWILNDIEAAGGNKEAARQASPSLETQVMVAYNYDYIARKNPVGFLGMVFMLESTSTQIANNGADALMTKLNLPKNAFSYLYSHGALDIEHLKFFESLVNRIESPLDQDAILEVAQNTFHLFANLFSALPHTRKKQNAA